MDDQQKPAVIESQDNTLGTVALVCGILAVIFIFCCGHLSVILGIVALTCGILGQQRQQQYALAGIILGAVGVVLGIVFVIVGYCLISGLLGLSSWSGY